MARIVVIDSSPLIGLAIVDGLAWLPKLFDEVKLPESVKQEVLPGKAARGEEAIAQAIAAGWLKVWPETIAPHTRLIWTQAKPIVSIWGSPFSWFPRAAWEPSADAPASCTVTLTRHKLHSHAARGNEGRLDPIGTGGF